MKIVRSYRKNVFCPPAFLGGIGASFPILEILKYSCGFWPTIKIVLDGKSRIAGKLGSAAILNQNPISEMASIIEVSSEKRMFSMIPAPKKENTDMRNAQRIHIRPRRARRKQNGCEYLLSCLRDFRVLRGELTMGRI